MLPKDDCTEREDRDGEHCGPDAHAEVVKPAHRTKAGEGHASTLRRAVAPEQFEARSDESVQRHSLCSGPPMQAVRPKNAESKNPSDRVNAATHCSLKLVRRLDAVIDLAQDERGRIHCKQRCAQLL